jgi:hypothetical protein
MAAGPRWNLWVPIVMATAQTAVESAIIVSHMAGRARKERTGGVSSKAGAGPTVVFASLRMTQAFRGEVGREIIGFRIAEVDFRYTK